ncbi:MAG: DedA family protein [Actinobacteria bacterium]|nr:DedA family protein [Actinomycetota bacterium]
MVERVVEFFRPYMADYGYQILALATVLENSLGVGLVVPGEALVLVAGFYAAVGHLDPVAVAAIASAGAIVGDNLGYGLGRRLGRGFLERHGRALLLTPERVAKADAFYDHHGGKTVFLGRFVPLIRSVVCFLAGVGHMRYPRFLVFDSAGAILWAVGHTALGYVAGRSYEELERFLGPAGLLLFVVLVALIAASIWFRRRRNARLAPAVERTDVGIEDVR